MKKRIFALTLAGLMAVSVTACGGKDSDTESGTETGSKTKTSADIELDLDEIIKELADYKNIPVELTGDYTVEEEDVTTTLESLAAGISAYSEVTDHTQIQDGDTVLCDYTGYQDGEAFDGGSATDQYVTVSDDNGYIDGFTDGLVGHSAGETVAYEVTFPDEYSNNPDLAGVTVTFEFNIKGIYQTSTITYETMTDDDVKNNFYSYYGTSTVTELHDYVQSYLEYQAESTKYQDEVTAVKDYMVANSKLEIPEEYLELRLDEYVANALTDWDSSSDQSKWDYIEETYGYSYDTLYNNVLETVSTELIFEKIADLEGVEIDEDTYDTYVSNMVSNYSFDDETAMYESFGVGDADDGKLYVQRLYRINMAIDTVVSSAQVTETSAEETTEASESTQQ